MLLRYTIKIAWTGLSNNKRRAGLTILGIVIGIVAIMLILSLGKGAQELIVGQVQGIGSTTIAVIPGRWPSGPADVAQVLENSLTKRDFKLLSRKDNLPHQKEIMPVVFTVGNAIYEKEKYQSILFGGTNKVAKIFNIIPAQGVFFSDDDIKRNANVVVLGYKVKDELFGDSQALGKKIKIKGKKFQVVAVLPQKGQGSIFDFDKMVFMPYTTAQLYVTGTKYFSRILVEVDDEKNVEQTIEDIKYTLRASHGIDDPKKDDFFLNTASNVIDRISVITDAMTYFLASVAGMSLLVGGIGIMTIMLVSVTERTREIGLRKALGATNSEILTQFLLEAVMLTLSGGIIGIILGALFMILISWILGLYVGVHWQYTFPVWGAVLGLGISVLVGILFGLYPAIKASKRSPIEAMRYD